MSEIQMGIVERHFADIIWENEPVNTSQLVKLAAEEFGWARTTTHTVVKRLCGKGIFVNNNGTVTSLISREQFEALQSRQFVENTFAGSLPAFIAAFTKGKSLSANEAAEIRKMINEAEEVE